MMLVHTCGGKCWLKTDADDCFIVLFCFKFMAISVTAGPDYLEGPINRPHCVALELQKTWWGKEKKKRWSWTWKSLQIQHRSHARFEMVHFLLQCPARNEDLSKLQRVLMGSPPPYWPIKVSPRRPLLDTSTSHQVRATDIKSTRA